LRAAPGKLTLLFLRVALGLCEYLSIECTQLRRDIHTFAVNMCIRVYLYVCTHNIFACMYIHRVVVQALGGCERYTAASLVFLRPYILINNHESLR